MGKRRAVVMLLASMLVATMVVPAAAAPPRDDQVWIVTLDEDHPSAGHAQALARRHGGSLRQVYTHALNGFSFRGPEQAARGIERNPGVLRVEADQPVRATGHVVPSGVQRIDAPLAHDAGHRGAGVRIAVLDTGIDAAHPALDVDVAAGRNCIDPGSTSTQDVNGHGTHVAGSASAMLDGSPFVGTATHAQVVPVKVLGDDGSGSWESVICGVDHITASAGGIRVANLSLSGPGSAGADCSASSLRQAICDSVASGVVYTVAAGNDGWNVANSVPAAYPEVITVSALDEDRCIRVTGGGPPRNECREGLASFSNHGVGVDVIAPGVGIYSTFPGDRYATGSGTSMAAPHVAGVAALMLSGNEDLGPDEVRAVLQGTGECPDGSVNATASGACVGRGAWFGDPDGVSEPLVDALRAAEAAGAATPPGDPQYAAPVADLSATCEDLTCTFTNLSTHDAALTATYVWTFGDGNGSTATDPVHTYAGSGTYLVTLTMTDDAGETASAEADVTVAVPGDDPVTDIVLGVTAYKLRGLQKADLAWSGTTGSPVDVLRDGSLVATVGDTGTTTDHIDARGGGTYTYRVCESGTDVCSDPVSVSF